jgi:hypothetical protein
MKVCLILLGFVMSFFLQTSSCNQRENSPIIKSKGPSDKVELVFFYKKSASYEEIQFFENDILHKPRPDGRGNDSQAGVLGEFFVRNSDYEGHAVEFYPNATPEQRENLKNVIKESPVVYKVYENVVPNEINDLPEAKKEEPNKTPDTRPAKEPKNVVTDSNS